MFSFESPLLAVCLLLPLLVYVVARARQYRELAAILVPDASNFAFANSKTKLISRQLWLKIILWAIYSLLVLALMRPVLLQDAVQIQQKGRDLMLAIDLSGSMGNRDMQVGASRMSRLQLIKQVAADFVNKRKGDRIGLVVFGAYAYMLTPLTFDRNAVIANIERAYPYDADDIQNKIVGTAIGDAIGLTIKRLQDANTPQKTLILLTDGSDNSSHLPPLKAAEIAKNSGLKIYTIGLGARDYLDMRHAELDENMLQEIAKITGGSYYRARNGAELEKIYAQIDQLEPVKSDSLSFRPQQSLYIYPLLAAMLLALLLAFGSLIDLGANLRAKLAQREVNRVD